MVKVTVVICTRRRPVSLKRCLEAVSRLIPAPAQVVVVDNTDGDEETAKVAQAFGARYAVQPQAGLGYARRRGMAESQADTVAFLDDQSEPPDNWLATLPPPRVADDTTESILELIHVDLRAGGAGFSDVS